MKKKKYRMKLRMYFSTVSIATLCSACVVSAIFVIGGMMLFYHGEITTWVAILLCLGICALTMLLGGTALYFGTSHFVKPLEEISEIVGEIAKGNFAVSVKRNEARKKDAEYENELDELKANINDMAAELAGMDHMRKDFVSNVSHEMKTPVASMMGFAEMLLEDDLPEEERQEYLELIHEEAARASRLCENMLRMSRLENQALVTKKERVRVDEQIRKTIILLSEKYPEKEMDYVLNLPELTVENDGDLLQQIWVNLIENAIKYSEDRRKIFISGGETPDLFWISIKDEGIGIPADKQNHIFDAFYQCEESHKTEGNGLGLSIVRRIVELLQGEIFCKSKENQGTKMLVKIKK